MVAIKASGTEALRSAGAKPARRGLGMSLAAGRAGDSGARVALRRRDEAGVGGAPVLGLRDLLRTPPAGALSGEHQLEVVWARGDLHRDLLADLAGDDGL